MRLFAPVMFGTALFLCAREAYGPKIGPPTEPQMKSRGRERSRRHDALMKKFFEAVYDAAIYAQADIFIAALPRQARRRIKGNPLIYVRQNYHAYSYLIKGKKC